MQKQQQQSIFKIPLVREITLVLLIKLVVIFMIKWQFFSDPVDLTQANNSVEQHMGLPNSPSTIKHTEN
ncbi:cytochrome oxidase putative small subunit CydP [Bermanella sp. WJH001]|uniref:cytochrome oxidase putative small subunit CydP n=1 Tax=Bermanella sp. WJH001 TaxID=3048005 RepID=UPI0024BEFD8E|nr:cytochrome oxidase putative small subunit CydP [Bermanella sp. WJH001]MDJ1538634.1 hypothetical protein [Bermanella sp. WJH001]